MSKSIEKFRKWASRAVPDGPLPNGSLKQAFGASRVVVLAIDDEGRVWQIEDGTMADAKVRTLANPRQEVIKVMDLFGVPHQTDEPPVVGNS